MQSLGSIRRLLGMGLLAGWCLAGMFAREGRAGGGPENWFLVVNSRSDKSVAIANHYIALRQLPSSNVYYLDWDGSVDGVDVETFRSKILAPVLRVIESRDLISHIDGIVYSADFPYSIEFQEDMPEGQRKQPGLAGSLTGLTYLFPLTLAKNPVAYQSGVSNQYYRGTADADATRGFRGWYGWGPKGELLESGGNRYMLSCMLGITAGKGNSVEEIIGYLKRAAESDGTIPKGTIYFMSNNDIRSSTRKPQFAGAVEQLKKLDVNAEVVQGVMPSGKADVMGAMLGISNFDWKASGSTILPGAFCDNLTSFGANMTPAHGQTVLSELLRYGAAGSSGTATEPGANPQKFPVPYLHVRYARGCTLAEAFYQSVYGPYQIALVGDPLCRPWAKIPSIQVEGAEAGSSVKGTLALAPSGSGAAAEVDRFELFVDGARAGACGKGGSIALDTAKYSDGYHELRVVGFESSPIETQGRAILPLMFNNYGKSMKFTAMPNRVAFSDRVRLTASASGARGIWIFGNGRILEKVNGDTANVQINANRLGSGPVTLRAVALGTGGTTTHVLAKPVEIVVE